jgi:ABC-type glycerol-3-phosphate transport system substrate-binding protein
MRKILAATVALLLLALLAGCGGGENSGPGRNPRQTVIAMFGAMEKNDQAALTAVLDLQALMQATGRDYAFQGDSARYFTNPQDVLNDLTGNGLTKRRWFSYQRIINESEVMGDNATVEVTFVDKAASRGYRTKFGLHKVNGKWKIYTFSTTREKS